MSTELRLKPTFLKWFETNSKIRKGNVDPGAIFSALRKVLNQDNVRDILSFGIKQYFLTNSDNTKSSTLNDIYLSITKLTNKSTPTHTHTQVNINHIH